MKVSLVLQLSSFIVGLCQARQEPAQHSTSTSDPTRGVPTSQLRMLSLGLAHLLHEVAESAKQTEQQGEQVLAELDGAAKSLESLSKLSLTTGRSHRQVRENPTCYKCIQCNQNVSVLPRWSYFIDSMYSWVAKASKCHFSCIYNNTSLFMVMYLIIWICKVTFNHSLKLKVIL